MPSKRSAFFTDSATILSQVKSQLEDVNVEITKCDVHMAIAKMKHIVAILDLKNGKQLVDRRKREAVENIKQKFKEMQNHFPDVAEVYITHVSFLQNIGLYAESYDHLEKMNLYETSNQLPLKITDKERVCTYDLLAKLYLRNGAIAGAREAATKALDHDPNYTPAKDVLRICTLADEYNERSTHAEKTWVKGFTFAYLNQNDIAIFSYLGIKEEEISSYVRKRSQEEAARLSLASTTFGFLAEMRKKLAQTVSTRHRQNTSHETSNPTLKRT